MTTAPGDATSTSALPDVFLLPVKVPAGDVVIPDAWVAIHQHVAEVATSDAHFVYLTVSHDPQVAAAVLGAIRPEHPRPADTHLLWCAGTGRFVSVAPAEMTAGEPAVLVSLSHRGFDADGAVRNAALDLTWPTWPARSGEKAMTLAEVHVNQREFAAALAQLAGRPVRFRPGANSSGGSRVADSEAGFWVVPEPGVMGVDCTDTALLAAELTRVVRPGCRVLDLTTGSGVNAVTAARCGGIVTANDIDPAAVACARANAARNGVTVAVSEGSLFDATVGTYDVIFGNPPFIANHPTPGRLEHNGSGWRAFVGDVYDALFSGARSHLAPGGQLLVVCAEWGDMDDYLAAAARHRWAGEAVAVRDSRDGLRRYRLDRWIPA